MKESVFAFGIPESHPLDHRGGKSPQPVRGWHSAEDTAGMPGGQHPTHPLASYPRSALTTMALGLSRSPRSTTPMASPLSLWTLMVLVASHVQNSVRL